MVAVVPIQHIQTAVGADFQCDWHEPGIVGGEQVRLGFCQVVAPSLVSRSTFKAAVDVADDHSLAILSGNASVSRLTIPQYAVFWCP